MLYKNKSEGIFFGIIKSAWIIIDWDTSHRFDTKNTTLLISFHTSKTKEDV